MTPKTIIVVAAFGNQTVNMWIPFEIPPKGMQNHNKPRREISPLKVSFYVGTDVLLW
jgi:hypothetical protein